MTTGRGVALIVTLAWVLVVVGGASLEERVDVVLARGPEGVDTSDLDDLLRTIPEQEKSLEKTRQELMASMQQQRAHLQELEDETHHKHRRHLIAKHHHLSVRRNRLMEDMQRNADRLKELKADLNGFDLDDTEHDAMDMVAAARRYHLPVSFIELEGDEVGQQAASAPQDLVSNVDSEPELEQQRDVDKAEQPVHRFSGLPQRVHFDIGSHGALECSCNFRAKETAGSCGADMADGRGPWMPAPGADGKLDPKACYQSCQEHKCAAVFKQSGFENWHACLKQCTSLCYSS